MNVIFFIYLFTDLGEKVKKSQLSSTFHVLRAVDVEGNTEEPGRGMGSGLTIYSSCGEGQSKWNQGRRVEGGLSTGKSELDGG